MMCKQKLCSRNKKIEVSGNCSVCENALVESAKAFEDKKKKVSTKVEFDLDLMVINILHEHDVIEELDDRIKD